MFPNLTPKESKICIICGSQDVKKWSKSPNKFFPEYPEGYMCNIHYRNEWNKEYRKGNESYLTQRRLKENARYASDSAYREKKLKAFCKGGQHYESKVANNKRYALKKEAKEKARARNKSFYHKDKESQTQRIKDIAHKPERQYTYIKARAKRCNIAFSLTLDEFKDIRQANCYYCEEVLNLTAPSIDRLNPNEGYHFQNCISCCSKCNQIKFNILQPYELKLFWTIKKGLFQIQSNVISIYQPAKTKLTIAKKYQKLISRGKKYNIPIDISKEEYQKIVAFNKCYYCNGPLSTAGYGLDRLNNDIHYTFQNSVPCCPICNTLKSNLLEEEDVRLLLSVMSYFRK